MAEIRRYWFVHHMRSEQNSHVLLFRDGRLVKAGRGLSFWFLPMVASIAEVPVDDRELNFLFHGHSSDHQAVVVQGTVSWRVTHAELLAQRLDFTLDLASGRYKREPLEQVAGLLTNLAQSFAEACTASEPVRGLLEAGVGPIRDAVAAGFHANTSLRDMGIEATAIHVASVRPSSDVERALQTPARELIQQRADQATFERRATAVENERAIAENELHNRIELAKREEALIDQRGLNSRREAQEAAGAGLIVTRGDAEQALIAAEAESSSLALVEKARVDAEHARMDIYRDLPQGVIMGLAAQRLAENLTHIDHLNISPELLGPLLTSLVSAGTDKLRG
jgi:regulator of protease activity HflC (stomatin/prohibitin superfamily)